MTTAELSPERAILMLLRLHDDEIRGKTVLQKLGYFLEVITKNNLGFAPHFYGPFSRKIDGALSLLVITGEVEEHSSVIGRSDEGWPVKHFQYRLTDTAQNLADEFISLNQDIAEKAKALVNSLREFGDDRSAKPLSLAAKVHFILSSRKMLMTQDQIREASKLLGWKITNNDVNRAIKILERLNLVQSGPVPEPVSEGSF